MVTVPVKSCLVKHAYGDATHSMAILQQGKLSCSRRRVRAAGVARLEVGSARTDALIDEAMGYPIEQTSLPFGKRRQGKVRDVYEVGPYLVLVTTDRLSAFDRVLATVPFKGQVLNQTTTWWLQHTRHILPNALVATPDPRVAIMHRCDVFPVEFVVRGYMTGSTATSLWTHYSQGGRQFCGQVYREGYAKNDRLDANVVTPSTKEEAGDRNISGEEIVAQGLMTEEEWLEAEAKALELFAFGQRRALQQGLILVDSKYELGRGPDGALVLLDEVHTPDSSRYWLARSYNSRHTQGQEPESIDKEFLRLWFKSHCDPYRDAQLPEAPRELVAELARRYIYLYETITGEEFQPAECGPHVDQLLTDRVGEELTKLGVQL